jgi:hypothetical protein
MAPKRKPAAVAKITAATPRKIHKGSTPATSAPYVPDRNRLTFSEEWKVEYGKTGGRAYVSDEFSMPLSNYERWTYQIGHDY